MKTIKKISIFIKIFIRKIYKTIIVTKNISGYVNNII